MHGPINVKSPNNTSKWQMGFNSAFKGLNVQNTERFIEVNKHFWSLEAINYLIVYINC